MYTFGIVHVLLPKQHAIFFVGINLLIVHSEIGHILLRLVYVFCHVIVTP
jgi:hypothetical protein